MTDISSIAVVGAGTMGSGIALTAAMNGIDAHQNDVSEAQLDRSRAYHAKTLARSVAKERLTQEQADEIAGRIRYGTDLGDIAGAQWVIEAATENLALKKEIFTALHAACGDEVILATNTSSISITDIGATVGPAASRVIGMHFFNPVPVMKLVEVIEGLATSEDTTRRTFELAERMGKTPIKANDRAGFVSNRVLMPMINEAFYAWMEGVAEPEAIDDIMKLGCAFPMGPLRRADFIGLDVCHHIMMVLYEELGDQKYFPCPKLRQLVLAGRLGDKSGHGVFDHSAG